MKILLIMPDAHMHKLRIGRHLRSCREAPLTLTTLAGMIPSDPDIEVKLVDGSVDSVPLDDPADLVGISLITGCANPAYSLADHFRKRGIPVVLGGVHVALLPGEAMRHADSIVVGRAEHAWPRLLADFRKGGMKRIYHEDPIEDDVLSDVPSPRRDLQRRRGYVLPDTVQATRGCRRTCDFCTVPKVWPKYLKRPVADVIRDIRSARGRIIVFNDVSLVDDPEYARELFTAMIPLKKRWGGLVTSDFAEDTELLDLMARSGCAYLLVGFESENPQVLSQIHKGFNKRVDYKELMTTLHDRHISVQGCFVFGFDHDDSSVFEATVQRVVDLGVDIPRYSLYTPYPGTDLFWRLVAENRVLSFNWDDYDTMHVVIRPARMTPEELYEGFKWAYRETFRVRHILKRISRPNFNAVVNFFGSLTYRIFVKRLYTEERYRRPYSMDCPGALPPAGDWAENALPQTARVC
jgi:radical SAM superfamily enzyme YgiQ (UPF0313 family)